MKKAPPLLHAETIGGLFLWMVPAWIPSHTRWGLFLWMKPA